MIKQFYYNSEVKHYNFVHNYVVDKHTKRYRSILGPSPSLIYAVQNYYSVIDRRFAEPDQRQAIDVIEGVSQEARGPEPARCVEASGCA